MISRPLLLSLFTAAATLGAPPLAASASTGGPYPAYPNSRLSISIPRTARASTPVTVTATGTNSYVSPDSPTTSLNYTLEVFVQLRSTLPSCAATYREALNDQINFPKAMAHIASSVRLPKNGRFTYRFRYQAGSARSVVYCAYTQAFSDDAAHAQLRATLAKPPARRR